LPHSILVEEEIKTYKMDSIQKKIGIELYVRIQKWALKKADWVMRFTDRGGKVLQENYKINIENRLIINPVGIDVPAVSKKIDEKDAKIRMLLVGRLIESKNITFVIMALSKMKDYLWELNIIGEGDQREYLENIVRDEGLESYIKFHGYCADVERWYEISDLMLFPSRLESFGLVILEAMSYGIPVIAMKPDGKKYNTVSDEIIDDEKTGWLVENEDKFSDILERIFKNNSIVAEVGAAARSIVEERFSWDKHINIYERLVT
jgi:glycosyltransferase involved in cell wall biosynthesis